MKRSLGLLSTGLLLAVFIIGISYATPPQPPHIEKEVLNITCLYHQPLPSNRLGSQIFKDVPTFAGVRIYYRGSEVAHKWSNDGKFSLSLRAGMTYDITAVRVDEKTFNATGMAVVLATVAQMVASKGGWVIDPVSTTAKPPAEVKLLFKGRMEKGKEVPAADREHS